MLYRYVADLPADGYDWGYGNAVGAGLIPTNDAETCVFVSTTPQRMRALAPGRRGVGIRQPARGDPTGHPGRRASGWDAG